MTTRLNCFVTCFLLITGPVLAQDIEHLTTYSYGRIGVSLIGGTLEPGLTPLENLRKGNYGATPGLALEAGYQHYFNRRSLLPGLPTKVGLDWTVGLNLNRANWDDYFRQRVPGGTPDSESGGYMMLAGIGLGPVLSVNPWEHLIVDLQAQLQWAIKLHDIEYREHDRTLLSTAPGRTDDESQAEYSRKYIARGVIPSFGLTVRRKWIGLSVMYLPTKLQVSYLSDQVEGREALPMAGTRIMLTSNF